MKPVVLASGNADKAREIREVLATAWGVPIVAREVTADEVQCFVLQSPEDPFVVPRVTEAPDVNETGSTLVENARIKARAWARTLGWRAVADDSGLFVDELDGAPGVFSARYAGEHATDTDNVAKLLDVLADVASPDRHAHFATVAIMVEPDGSEIVAHGEVQGEIATIPVGENGFGYDPVFIPLEGDGRTFAQMSAAEKHAISHRGRAFTALAQQMR